MKVQPQTAIRWTSEEARKLHVQLLGKIEAYNAEIRPKLDALIARGRQAEAAKLLDDHRWAMQPLINNAARLFSEFTVPFMIVSTEITLTSGDTRETKE